MELPTNKGEDEHWIQEAMKDGQSYQGQFKKGEKHGFGEVHSPDGSHFRGNFVHDVIKGQGNYNNVPFGSNYRGDWDNDEMSGKGVFEFLDGRKYEGDFERNDRHGQGVMSQLGINRGSSWELSGQYITIYDGGWDENYQDGEGTYTFLDGTVKKGVWGKLKPSDQFGGRLLKWIK